MLLSDNGGVVEYILKEKLVGGGLGERNEQGMMMRRDGPLFPAERTHKDKDGYRVVYRKEGPF